MFLGLVLEKILIMSIKKSGFCDLSDTTFWRCFFQRLTICLSFQSMYTSFSATSLVKSTTGGPSTAERI